MYNQNRKVLTEGWHVGSQTPIDDRLVFTDLADLQNLGTGNVNAFRYYEGMQVWVLTTNKEYIWVESAIGALTSSFTYPPNTIVNGVIYSGRSFNFVETGFLAPSLQKDLVKDWSANTAYVLNEEITAISPTTSKRTFYRRTAAGLSGAIFDTTEEALWTTLSVIGGARKFADNTTVAPAITGKPSTSEITVFATNQNFKDGLLYYTGDDLGITDPTHIYWVDDNGVVTTLKNLFANMYSDDHTFIANTSLTITHNLKSTDIIVQLKSPSGQMIIPDVVNNYTLNTVDIKVAVAGIYRVIIK